MSRIRIKNFGPIKEGLLENDGWMDIKKVTVFIGNQGSGKSTIAKLISTMSWIEKALTRGDLPAKLFTTARFLGILKYQRINNYFNNELTEIQYEGDSYYLDYSFTNKFFHVRKKNGGEYLMPKIMYVPSERNFFGAIGAAFETGGLPKNILNFAEEYRKAQYALDGEKIHVPINDIKFEYDLMQDKSIIHGKDYALELPESSSGLQSAIPLFLVSRYLSLFVNQNEEMLRGQLNANQLIKMDNEISTVVLSKSNSSERDEIIDEIKKRYFTKCFINIVEEPEQNLFPSSQRGILNALLEFNNRNERNRLIITTHSPYLINYLTLAVEAHKLKPKVNSEDLKTKLNGIVPWLSTVGGNDLVVYQLDEKNGSIEKLKEYKGLPSDENYLNEGLAESNDEFSKLLDIEDLCQ